VAALSISGAAFTSKHHNATMNQASTITSINSGDRPPGDLISIGRLSQYLGCSERHIYNLRKRGLPVFEIGDMVSVPGVARRLKTRRRRPRLLWHCRSLLL
jgi:hypothetical protein